jgi:hypothetical protein
VSEEFFSFFVALFLSDSFRGLAETPLLRLATRHLPHSSWGRMARILAWPREKFTKNFSIGKKNRLRCGSH